MRSGGTSIGLKRAMLLALVLAGCDQEPSLKGQGQRVPISENDAMRSLADAIKVQDGLLFVRDELFGRFESYVLPRDTPWMISCGLTGLVIVLGPSAGSGEDASGGAEVNLSFAPVAADDCQSVSIPIAKRMLQLTGKDGP